MRTVTFNRVSPDFDTIVEARAFIRGVEFTNDSALRVMGIHYRSEEGVFEVFMIDEDSYIGTQEGEVL
jgi:hypothetical protein